MSVEDTAESICKLIGSSFEYVDSLTHRGGACQTFTLSIHVGADIDVYPTACLNAFIHQIKAAIKPTDLVYCLEIHGPLNIDQNCFLNRRLHKHHIWDVTIQLAATGPVNANSNR